MGAGDRQASGTQCREELRAVLGRARVDQCMRHPQRNIALVAGIDDVGSQAAKAGGLLLDYEIGLPGAIRQVEEVVIQAVELSPPLLSLAAQKLGDRRSKGLGLG